MKREIAELRETIVKLTQLLANKKLKVTQMGADAWVRADPRTREPVHVNLPNVPDTADDALITAIQGFLDHEVAHILFTDWSIITTDPQLHNLHNMLEDTFIERKMGELFPGARSNIKNTGAFFLERITIPQLKKVAGNEKDEFSWLLVPTIRALSGQSVFQDFMDDGDWWKHPFVAELVSRLPDDVKKRIPAIESTKEGLEIARVFHGIIYPKTQHPPIKAPPPPSQPQDSDEKDDQAGDGQGQGKKEHEEDSDKASSPEPTEDDDGKADESEEDGDSEGSSAGDRDEKDEDQGDDEDETGGSAGEDDEEEGDDDNGADDRDDGAASDADKQSDEDEAASEEEDQGDGNAADQPDEDSEAGSDEDEGGEDGDDEAGDREDEPKEESSDEDAGESGSDGEDEDAGNGLSGADEGEEEKDEKGESEGQKGGSSAGDSNSDDEANEGEDESEAETLEESQPEELDQGAQTMSTPDQDDGDSSSKGSCFSPEDTIDASGLDLSAAVVSVIAKTALEALLSAPYTVFSRDFDKIEVIEPDGSYRDAWMPQLEEETRQMVGKMQKDVERMMASQSRVLRVGMQRKGRINAPALHRLMAGDDRVFMHKEEHRSKETAVTLLIDNSGSMGGIKYTTAMVAAYALASTLDRVNIANEAIGFTTAWSLDFPQAARDAHASAQRKGVTFSREVPIHMPIFKEFDERLNPTVRKRFAFGAYAQPGRGANVDGESLEIAAQRLLKRRERRKVMIVLSDGAPAGGHHVHIPQHLRSTVLDLSKKGIDLVGIGIMDSNVKRYYPNSVVLNNVADLPGQVMSELKRILA